ncbi:Fatty acyl-CoA reductase wat [Eumeta japonica]|uniref:Fatty acyl-CoA reductase n=1 Tax=Eumeta variegata TaxID=151549 RepID=A0A4C1XNY6_EUMVA|nr:Fatty acyl-CoA reductase wat [Eumeta japonica]
MTLTPTGNGSCSKSSRRKFHSVGPKIEPCGYSIVDFFHNTSVPTNSATLRGHPQNTIEGGRSRSACDNPMYSSSQVVIPVANLKITRFNILPRTEKSVIGPYAFRSVASLPFLFRRPMVASYREPAAGWIDVGNVYGPSGLLLGIGLGVLHSIPADTKQNLDLVPVDMVNNLAIAAAYDVAESGINTPTIYNYSSTKRNPMHWSQIQHILENDARKIVTPMALWYNFSFVTPNKYLYAMMTFLWHTIPAYLLDAGAVLIGKEQRFKKIYSKVSKLTAVLSFFTLNEWVHYDENTNRLYSRLCGVDKELFNFDITTYEWPNFILIWCLGTGLIRVGGPVTSCGERTPLRDPLQGKSRAVNTLECCPAASDESTDSSDMVRLAIFIRGVDKELTVIEKLTSLDATNLTSGLSRHARGVILLIPIWGDTREISEKYGRKLVSPMTIWYAFGTLTPNRYIHMIMCFLWHTIPAYIMDFGATLMGKEPRFRRLYTKMHKLIDVLAYFNLNEWEYHEENVDYLRSSLGKADNELFNFDIGSYKWLEYMQLWFLGIRKFIVKDELKNTELGIRKQFWFRIAQQWTGSIKTPQSHRIQTRSKAAAVAFRPVFESSDGSLSLLSLRSLFTIPPPPVHIPIT